MLTRTICVVQPISVRPEPVEGISSRPEYPRLTRQLSQMETISAPTTELWNAHLCLEQDCVRSSMLLALDRFIDAFVCETPVLQESWAISFAGSIADHRHDMAVRMPLFRRVLLPHLTTGVLESRPGCARWLAHFGPLLARVNDSRLPEQLQNVVGLLKAALALDPQDQAARQQLVETHASYMNYTLHELPAGVLYGMDGANLSECDELLELLSEFTSHIELLNQRDIYAKLVDECELHYNAYRAYLSAGRAGCSYERFVESRMQPTLPHQS